ncbi:MAG TPA: hypothetical protein VFE65_12175 [Pseudonocardia sp.]|nr:hypothetical protein [Pseudonocardia sp.]
MAGIEGTTLAQTPEAVAGVVAGFIVWLAHQGLDTDYRHRCPITAEQFLRWQARRRYQQLPASLDDYCTERASDGAMEAEVAEIRSIIEKLATYLEING